MKEFPFEEHDKDFAVARQKMKEAWDNPAYQAYAAERGPLLLADISKPSSELIEVAEKYGWPTVADGDGILASKVFEDDNEFTDALFMFYADGGVNNFKNWIETRPTTKDDVLEVIMNGGNLQDATFGLHPALHRAYALVPDFMHSLHDAYKALLARENAVMISRELLASEDGRLVVEGMHNAYKILARLLTQADQQIAQANPMADLVTDARKELSA